MSFFFSVTRFTHFFIHLFISFYHLSYYLKSFHSFMSSIDSFHFLFHSSISLLIPFNWFVFTFIHTFSPFIVLSTNFHHFFRSIHFIQKLSQSVHLFHQSILFSAIYFIMSCIPSIHQFISICHLNDLITYFIHSILSFPNSFNPWLRFFVHFLVIFVAMDPMDSSSCVVDTFLGLWISYISICLYFELFLFVFRPLHRLSTRLLNRNERVHRARPAINATAI